MKLFSGILISALCLGDREKNFLKSTDVKSGAFTGLFKVVATGIANGHIIGILRELSPMITDLGDTITNVLKDTGGLIGHTFSSVDSIVENAEDSIVQFNKEISEILLGTPDDSQHQHCATLLRSASQSVNTTIVRVCVDQVKIRNTLSERLVEISKLKSQCMSTFTRCLKTPPVDQCIQSEVEAVRTGIQQNEVVLQRDVEVIKTEVQQCVETRKQQACGTLQTAINEYKRCCGDQ